MAIRVRRGLAGRLRAQAAVPVLVTGPHSDRLAGALHAALAEIREIGLTEEVPDEPEGGVRVVGGPIPVPVGYLLILDTGPTPPAAAVTVPSVLARNLEQAGVENAEIRAAPEIGNRYLRLDEFIPDARALLCGQRRAASRPFDGRLAGIAMDWLRVHQPADAELVTLIGGVELAVAWDTADHIAAEVLTVELSATVLATDFRTAAASAVLGECLGDAAALHACAPGLPAADIGEFLRDQRETIRRNAGQPFLAWAGATALPHTWYLTAAGEPPEETRNGPMWYQLLSEERLCRLGGPPPGAVRLPGDRVELTIGEPEQWLPGRPEHAAVLALASQLLPDTA
jgi:hypothetical protein